MFYAQMSSIRHILAPVDFSAASNSAVRYGLALARQCGAKITVLHVIPSSSALTHAFPDETFSIAKERYAEAKALMTELIPVEHREVLQWENSILSGNVSEEILRQIQEAKIDFVVMGTHGRTAPARWIVGSVTEGILRKLTVPVLTVSLHVPDERLKSPDFFSVRRILYATDLTDSSAAALRLSIGMVEGADGEVLVVHVMKAYREGVVAPEIRNPRVIEATELALRGLAVPPDQQRVKIETLVKEGEPGKTILEAARDHQSDIIVINLKRKERLDRVFFGSAAEHVIRNAPVPVLSVPA
jgi:nucleotide-binding universal stress UspA family protein